MKCPLMKAEAILPNGAYVRQQKDCIQEECAWWDARLSQCSIRSLVGWLDALSLELNQIKDKMPKGGN